MAEPVEAIRHTAGNSGTATGSMLFVCTANRIRSPFAAAFASRVAAENNLALVASSAGLDEGGLPAMDQIVSVATRWDIDLRDHQSRQVTAGLIDNSDLVITMTGSHVVDLAATYPEALPRLVTLREAAQVAWETGAPQWDSAAMRDWGAQIAQRPLDVLLGGAVDVVDPVGSPRRVYKRTAGLIVDLVEQLLLSPTGSDAGVLADPTAW